MPALPHLAALGLAAAALAGCARQEASHDKTYYGVNAAERAAELAACQNNPGRMAGTANCINAQAADADAHAKTFYDLQKPAARVQQPGKL